MKRGRGRPAISKECPDRKALRGMKPETPPIVHNRSSFRTGVLEIRWVSMDEEEDGQFEIEDLAVVWSLEIDGLRYGAGNTVVCATHSPEQGRHG